MEHKLDVQQLQKLLIDRNIHYPLFVYDVIDSTNLEAFRLLDAVQDRCVIVLSKVQTQGRGTHGRVWEDNHGQLSLSIGFKECILPEKLNGIRVLLNRYFCEKLIRLFYKPFYLKDPNDILWEGKKLSGVLLESKVENNLTTAWVMGLGMNIYHAHHKLWSKEVQESAVSLQDILAGKEIDINFLAAEFIQITLLQHPLS
ncbi:MAG: biotin--[acetyl-CoA-carboxylase] ligase [Puniceicoccales bacterium]|jgi:BirA family biotin operon repressor/biotin-[acetyl-CoA-carboxylase] ligase|nr:biotin--[acetyl-CoA-carboxylase] ligase [Puniceicoccales bacterium]